LASRVGGRCFEVRLDGARYESFDEDRSVPVTDRRQRSLVDLLSQVGDDGLRREAGVPRGDSARPGLTIDGRIRIVFGHDDRLEERQERVEVRGWVVLLRWHELARGSAAN